MSISTKTYKVPFIKVRIWLVLLVVTTTMFQLHGQSTAPVLTVTGEVLKSQKFGIDDLRSLKQTELMAKDHGGKDRLFKGVALADLLGVGATLGGGLRGKNLLKYVVVSAADSYKVVFSLAEVDPEFTSQTILPAYEVDGKVFEIGDGPIVPNAKKHARWIREVSSIEVVSAK